MPTGLTGPAQESPPLFSSMQKRRPWLRITCLYELVELVDRQPNLFQDVGQCRPIQGGCAGIVTFNTLVGRCFCSRRYTYLFAGPQPSYLAARPESPPCRRGREVCSYYELDLFCIRAEGHVVFDGFQVQLDGLANILERFFFAGPFTDTAGKSSTKTVKPPSSLGSSTVRSFILVPVWPRKVA